MRPETWWGLAAASARRLYCRPRQARPLPLVVSMSHVTLGWSRVSGLTSPRLFQSRYQRAKCAGGKDKPIPNFHMPALRTASPI